MTLRSPFTCVLWDVDGTVVDASEGILRRLAIALEHFGKPAATRDELVHWIGPPMFDSFQANVGMTPEEATEAVAYYRMIGKADGSPVKSPLESAFLTLAMPLGLDFVIGSVKRKYAILQEGDPALQCVQDVLTLEGYDGVMRVMEFYS